MESINVRTTLKLIVSFSWFVVMALVGSAYAGDYYTYQDPNGNLVIANNPPPPGSKVVKKETLPEGIDSQTAESETHEVRAALDDRIASLEKTIGELTDDLRYQAEVINNLQQGHGDTNIAVGVTQGPAVVARPLPNKVKRAPNFKNNFPNDHVRPVVPTPPQARSGGRPG